MNAVDIVLIVIALLSMYSGWLKGFILGSLELIMFVIGAQSTLYGSDAIAGVINIITVNQDVKKPVNVKATLSGGNLGTFKGSTQLYGKVNNLTYSARYAKLTSKGFSTANDRTGTGNFDSDGYNSDVASASLKYDITKSLSAKTFVQYSRYKTDIDAGQFTDDKAYTSQNKNLIAGAGLQYKSDIVTITGNYQYSDNTRNLLDDSTYNPGSLSRNDFYGKSNFVEIYSSVKMGSHFNFLQGADYRNNAMNLVSFGTYPASIYGPAGSYGSKVDSAISQASLYSSLTYSGFQQKLNIDLGGRLNVNSRYGSNASYTFNPSFAINDHIRFLGSVSTAYKTPSVYQLYSNYGNKELKVEESKSYELGAQLQHKALSNRIVYFYRDISNGIDFNNISYKYFNINKQIVRGIEYELKANLLKNINITANYTYLSSTEYSQSRQNFKDTAYNYLLKRPKHTVNATVGYQITPELFFSLGARYASKRNDVGGYKKPDVVMDSYFIMNAYAQYTFTRNLKVFADAQNLTNKKFFEVYGYNSIPFLFKAGLTFTL